MKSDGFPTERESLVPTALVECGFAFIHFQSTYNFVGRKSRTKEQLQTKMYCDEMETWLAEERLEESKTQVKL